MSRRTSRQEFAAYREKLPLRRKEDDPRVAAMEDADGAKDGKRNFKVLFVEFWALLRGHRGAVLFALGTLTIATILNLAPPAVTKIAVDYILLPQPSNGTEPKSLLDDVARWLPADRFQALLAIGGGVIAISLASTVINLWGRWLATRAVNRVQVGIRKNVFEHAVRLPLHRVYEMKSGGAASLLREDAGGASDLIFSMIYNPWRAIVQLAGSLIILALVDWRLMLGGLLLIPLVFITHRTWIARIRPLYRDVRKQRQTIDGQSTEAFGGMRIVRAFSRERSETNRFVRGNNLMVRQQLFVWWWARIIDIAWSIIIPLASSALLIYGGRQILSGEMTIGDLTMFLFYLMMLLDPLATLASSATAFQNNLAGLDRILDLLEEDQAMPATVETRKVSPETSLGRITFEDVSFRYPGGKRDVLKNISLQAEPGEVVALVGKSGAGKTTLCNLAARFYDPTSGEVKLDGCNLADIDVESYRRMLGVVEQDVFLFDGTIAENIMYGARDADQDAMINAARAAQAHEFVLEFEKGYETLIGERGVKLSGGQRQRLAIARALIADPKILILDEATSNLDSESERLIQNSLNVLMQGRTCFVIAHRMSTIQLANRIVVLDDGEMIESGTHQELLQKDGHYHRMVQLQTSGV